MASTLTYIRQLYGVARRWRHRHDQALADNLDFSDFIDYAKEFQIKSGLRPLLITDDGIFIRTGAGFFLWFDPRFEHGTLWGVEKDGVWEPGIIKLCVDKLRHGGTFLDIGANVGMFSMSVANELHNVAIHAFEPVPANFSILELNLNVNNMEDRIVVNNLAVSHHCSTISMVVNGQLSHVIQNESKDKLTTVSINTVSVDYYCDSNEVTDVQLIKCDVEGFELDVLRGAEKVIRSQRPALVLEIEEKWTSRYGYSAKDIFSFLQEFGYSGMPILYSGALGDKNTAFAQKINQSNVFLFEIE